MTNFFKTIAVIYLLGSAVHSQTVAEPLSLDTILDNTGERSREYVETFKNLSAEETKTFVIYKKNGDESKRKTIKSLILVVPLSKDPGRVVEFRNVISVDGRPVKNGDKRAGELFEKLSNSETTDDEIKRLANESSRFDEQIYISGMTLFRSPALDQSLRPFFRFELDPASPTDVLGRYVVRYEQVREAPGISINGSGSKAVSNAVYSYDIEVDKDVELNARLSGTLVIDAQTFRLWAETRRVTIQPQGFSSPSVVIEDRFEFQDSPFGINTPKAIIHSQYKAKIKDRKIIKEAEISFVYGSFTKADVEVKSGEVKPQ